MHFHKTALNLIVVDFNTTLEKINKEFKERLDNWGLLTDTIKEKEKERLLLYLYVKYMTIATDNNKNTVFYVTDLSSKKYIDIITKYIPFIIHYGNLDFSWIKQNTGETKEILEGVKTTRFNFDYSLYPAKKTATFYKKYKIQPYSNEKSL